MSVRLIEIICWHTKIIPETYIKTYNSVLDTVDGDIHAIRSTPPLPSPLFLYCCESYHCKSKNPPYIPSIMTPDPIIYGERAALSIKYETATNLLFCGVISIYYIALYNFTISILLM